MKNVDMNLLSVRSGARAASALLAGACLCAAHVDAQQVSATITTGNAPAALAVNPATNQIYVANRTDNTVTVINGANDYVAATLHDDNAVVPTIATVPTEIAVDTTANQIYVSNWASCTAPAPGINQVMQIDGSSLITTPLGTGGVGPTGIAVNPITHTAYVSNICDGTLSVLVNGTFLPILANRTGAVMPNSVAINPVTNKTYFATYSRGGPGFVIALDGATNLTTSLAVGNGPTAIAVNVVTNMIYVANQTDGTVTVIDGATFTVVTTVTVGALPMQLALNPVTDKLYVVNQNGNSVSVIDGATNAATTIPVGVGPDGIAVDTLTNQVYVANGHDNTVSVIDGASQTVNKTLAVGTNPTAVAVNPVTNHVYVANRGANTVTVIDATPAPTVAQIPVGRNPRGAALNPLTGQVFISNQDDGTVTAVGPAPANATATSAVSAVTGAATMVSVLAGVNRIAVASAPSGGVQGQLSILDGTSLQTIGTTFIPSAPVAAAFNDATGYLYIVNSGSGTANGSITAINSSTLGVATSVPVGQAPVGMAIDAATSQVYVANASSGTVTALGVSGTTFTTDATIAVAGQPAAITLNPATGLVYVVSQNGTSPGTLSIIDPSSNTVTSTIAVGAAPAAVAVNANTNEIYVANKGDATVTRIEGYGNLASTISNVGANPHALAIDALNDRIFVADDVNGDNLTAAVTVIDGVTSATSPEIRTGAYNSAILVNPTTGEAYAPDGAGNVYTIAPAAASPNPMSTVITGVTDAQTISAAPFETANLAQMFQAAAADNFTVLAAYQGVAGAANPAPQALYYQLDGAAGTWQVSTPLAAAPGTFALRTGAVPGLHTLYAFPAYGREGSSQSTGNGSGNSPEMGPIVALPALIVAGAAPPASAPCASPCVISTNVGPITVTADHGGIGAVQYANAPPNAPAAIQTPFGYYSFSVGGLNPGATVTVTFGVPFGFTLSGYEKCINGACAPLPGATINNGGSTGPTLSISLTDGGLNDADGAANGTIVDPGALLATGAEAVPSAPSGLELSVSNGQVSLSWTASSNAQGYDVYQGTAANGESATPVQTMVAGISTTVGGLANGTTYFFRIAAVNGTSVSAYSNEVSAVPNSVPAQVTGLAATAGDAQAALAWTAVSGASGYTVFQGTTAGGETALASGVTATSYTAAGLANGTTYYYTVAAMNSAGTGPQSSEVSAQPAIVVTVTGRRGGGGAIDAWTIALLCGLLVLRTFGRGIRHAFTYRITGMKLRSHRRSLRTHAWLYAGAALVWLLPFAVGVAAGHKPPADMPGITSSRDLASGLVPLKPADLQFYIKILRTTVARYEHPTAKDLADIAEAKRLRAVEMTDQQNMARDLKAGNTSKAMNEDMFQPTPEQAAALERGNAFTYGSAAEIFAEDAGMRGGQWLGLSEVVERAARLNAAAGYGSADDSPTPKPTAAALARAAAWRRTAAADETLVAPSVVEIKRLKTRLTQLLMARTNQ